MQSFSKLKIFAVVAFSTALYLATSITASAGTTPEISSATYKTGVAKIMVNFNVPVWGDSALTTAVQITDFQLGGTCVFSGSPTISSDRAPSPGDTYTLLTIAGAAGADETSCTIAAKANSIFTVGGALSEKTESLASDTTGPVIQTAKFFTTNSYVLITLNEQVFGDAIAGDAIDYNDITLTNGNGAGCTSFTNNAVKYVGADFIIDKCDVSAVAGDVADTVNFAGGASVYDALGNASAVGAATSLAEVAASLTYESIHPAFDLGPSLEACVGCTNALVRFTYPAFNAAIPDMDADVATSDFLFTDTGGGGKTLSSAMQTTDNKWAMLGLSSAFLVADITTATVDTIERADATSLYDPWGRSMDVTTIDATDNTRPTILSVTKTVTDGVNTIALQYSEKIKFGALDSPSESSASTATLGDYTLAGTVTGLGAFATGGDISSNTTKNTVALSADQKTVYVYLAGEDGGFIGVGGPTEPSGIFTPSTADATDRIRDLEPNGVAPTGNSIETTTIQSTITSSSTWDIVQPTLTSITISEGAGLINGKIDKATLVFNSDMKDANFTPADGSLALGVGTFSTGDANDETMTFNRTADTATTGTAATNGDFTYSGVTTPITDRAGNPLNSASDGAINTAEGVEVDGATPVLLTAQWSKAANQNNLTLTYSEALTVYTVGGITQILAGNEGPSTTSLGDMTTAKTITGLLSWLNGTVDFKNKATAANTIALDGTSKIITLTFNDTAGSFFSAGSVAPSGAETLAVTYDANYIKDAVALGAVAPTAGVTVSVGTAWDATPPSQITGFGSPNSSGTSTTLVWTSHGALADFSRYMLGYATSTGVSLSSSLWTSTNDSNLLTRTTSSSTITGLTLDNNYFSKIYAIDIAGNVSVPSSETNWLLAGAGGGEGGGESGSGTPASEPVTPTEPVAPITPTEPTTPTTEPSTEPTTPTTEPTTEPITPTVPVDTTTVTIVDITGKEVIIKDDEALAESPDRFFIEAMITAGIFKGNADGTVQPDVSIKRSEVATVLYRILGLPEPPYAPAEDPYLDVPKDEWYAGYVKEMKDMKFVSDKVSSYVPEMYANKAEFLRFAMNVYKLLITEEERAEIKILEETAGVTFSDVSADAWYAKDVAVASAKGFITGTECRKGTCFYANATITRGNAAEILYYMFGEILGVK